MLTVTTTVNTVEQLTQMKTKPVKVLLYKNRYRLHKDYVEVVLENLKQQNEVVALVDYDDLPKLIPYKWRLSKQGYAINRVVGYMHRYILNSPKGSEVDHIFHNPLDNRKSKIRVCTSSQNSMNKTHQRNSKTKVRGVYKCKSTGRYACEIKVNKKRIWLGRYDTLEEATVVRQQAELKYFKNYNYKGEN